MMLLRGLVRRVGTSDGKKAVYIYGIHMEPYQRFLRKQLKGLKGKDALTTDDLIAHAEAVEELTAKLISFSKMVIRTLNDCGPPNPHAYGEVGGPSAHR